MEWLTEEEQYKDDLTSREIERIKDEELRNIRRKYHKRMLRNFHDEKNISDKELIKMKNLLLNELGKEIGEKYGVEYLFGDFKKREGYKRSIILSKEYDLYRQEYCGCEFSLRKED